MFFAILFWALIRFTLRDMPDSHNLPRSLPTTGGNPGHRREWQEMPDGYLFLRSKNATDCIYGLERTFISPGAKEGRDGERGKIIPPEPSYMSRTKLHYSMTKSRGKRAPERKPNMIILRTSIDQSNAQKSRESMRRERRDGLERVCNHSLIIVMAQGRSAS